MTPSTMRALIDFAAIQAPPTAQSDSNGTLPSGKVLPAGIGAIVGGVGNRMMGKRIVENARAAFGAAPARWRTARRAGRAAWWRRSTPACT